MSGFRVQLKHYLQQWTPYLCNIVNYNRPAFTVHLPNLITVNFLLFIMSQFATHAPSALHLNQYTYGHV